MAILLSAQNLSKSFAHRKLFERLSFGIQDRDRIALIGPNGAGKSSLLKIMAGLLEADHGEIAQKKGLKVGYVAQSPEFPKDATVSEALAQRCVEQGSDPHDWELLSKIYEYASLLELESAGISLESKVDSLSGGWRKRIAIVRELLPSPELLLLDEPTNHLDVAGILWLESLLQSPSFSIVVITHDRVFLQRVATVIFELDRRNPGGLLRVDGDYLTYCERKEQQLASDLKTQESLTNTLRRETEWLRRGPKARTTKQNARIHRAEDLKEEVASLSERLVYREVDFDFQGPAHTPKKLLELKGLSKSFGSHILFKNFDFLISRKTRLGLLGNNGCGKSTFIKVLLGELPPDAGEALRSDQLKVAYFDQSRSALDPEATVMRTVCPEGDHVRFRGQFVHVRSYLDRFLFSSDQMDVPVKQLSGGEQARLLIARLMLQEANLLVLDEPTNDLDFATLNVLEDQLKSFPGALILVCHDRYFLDQVCDTLLAFPVETDSGVLEEFHGVLQWESWFQEKKKALEKSAKASPPVQEKSSSSVGTPPPQRNKLSYKEQRELEQIEPRLLVCEKRLEELTLLSADAGFMAIKENLLKTTQEMADLQKEIDHLYHRWQVLEQGKL